MKKKETNQSHSFQEKGREWTALHGDIGDISF